MGQETIINYRLNDFFKLIMKNVIESNIRETPEKIPTFIAVNNMLNQLDGEISSDDITNLISETLINKVLDEIRNII